MCGTPSITFTIVDAMPNLLSPPSIKHSTFPSKSFITLAKFVALGLPDIFALGVAIGTFAYSTSFLATSPAGILIPTVSCPAVTISGTMSFFFNMMVNGPGKNSFINLYSKSVISFAT